MLIPATTFIFSLVLYSFYITGQGLHLLSGAYLSIHSNLNSVTTYKSYFCYRWVPVSLRVFLALCAFMIIWDNPDIMDLSKFIHSPAKQWAAAGILGVFSDSVLDKVLAAFPLTKRDLPAIDDPGPMQDKLNSGDKK